jgi:small subunit ribosomal protein S1
MNDFKSTQLNEEDKFSSSSFVNVRINKVVEGKIIGRAKSAVFLDLGILGTGIIFGKEFQDVRSELRNLKIGESISAKIIDIENEDGYVELSFKEAVNELNWNKVRQIKEKDEVITVKISGVNKGGLLTNVFKTPAFLPISHFSLFTRALAKGEDKRSSSPKGREKNINKILKELQDFISKELEVKIFNFDKKQNKIILSTKGITDNNLKLKEDVFKNYKIGDIVEGEITGITNFGVFIRFTGIEGLIHISELDWQIVEDPLNLVKVGEKVKAKIISIENNKIFLSLKALKQNPWENIEKKYKKGNIIKGKVLKFNSYGAFVQITSKIQGLCHISNFGTKTKMEEDLKINKKYDFQILSINTKEYRINLKLVEKNEK